MVVVSSGISMLLIGVVRLWVWVLWMIILLCKFYFSGWWVVWLVSIEVFMFCGVDWMRWIILLMMLLLSWVFLVCVIVRYLVM